MCVESEDERRFQTRNKTLPKRLQFVIETCVQGEPSRARRDGVTELTPCVTADHTESSRTLRENDDNVEKRLEETTRILIVLEGVPQGRSWLRHGGLMWVK